MDCFVDEVIKLETKMNFLLKNTNKEIIMKEEDEADFKNNNIHRFCENEILFDKVGDHCHLTGR